MSEKQQQNNPKVKIEEGKITPRPVQRPRVDKPKSK